ncbi:MULTISPECIES: ABC transporter substrate-binding protein [Staphylococcus]|uniref:ABC transporter substrate-binding protein n=1 Tax=Staphylococcus TaxID=1279 RepID=UPI000E68AF66|nr:MULTISPECIES: ABC transporter substrate-binding protein [Staphylococcus]MCE5008440.1 ABC transporter substrate-binding protein [Staphylococcus equorum]MDU0440557.1 ABC transporter substrate-binding protein [Staphylococcus haemolyticus]RIO43771.1 ABC transporter substrate-binding protein [Staphylococcus nepalensis]
MKIMLNILIIFFIFLLAGCSNISHKQNFSDITNQDWSAIEESSDDTTVRMFMWGGDKEVNEYIDDWLIPKIKDKYNITLERVPMDTEEILQKLHTEKQAGKNEGTVDIIWLNGENFNKAKSNDLLAGSFVDKLPNFNKYYDTEDPSFQKDFGTPVEGMEAPWGKVQFVFHYDSKKIDEPPKSFKELKQWISRNPGKFTYPDANDFTGNSFLRHILYANSPNPENIYDKNFEDNDFSKTSKKTWAYLNEIEPNLWREGKHHPNTLTELDQLYSKGEVWMTMGYNEARGESLIDQGVYPKSTRSFVMHPGSIGNTHFLSIPFNSSNVEGALTAINFMLSPEAQLEKFKPNSWGDNTPITIEKLPEDIREDFQSVNRGRSVLPKKELENNFLPESDPAYVNWIKEQWLSEVIKK